MFNDGAMSLSLSNEIKSAERQQQAMELALRFRTYDSLEIRCSDEACFLVVTVLGSQMVMGNGRGEAKGHRHAWQIREWLHSRFEIVVDRPADKAFRSAPRNTQARVAKQAGARRRGVQIIESAKRRGVL